jgi:SAM-dependent methyltransferase
MTSEVAPVGVDPTVPNAARMYDYYLGGKDNFAVDRAAAVQGRALIKRVVERLVRDAGITQIIDIGSGLPTGENVHEIAHAINPAVRVVYVDHDTVVCAHGRALLARPDRVLMANHDLRQPAAIVDDERIRRLIDFTQPVAILMMYVLHLIPDEDDPHAIVAAYRDAVAPGSYLAVSHASSDARPDFMAKISAIYERANSRFVPRRREDIEGFFGAFELVPPGLVHIWPYESLPAGVDQDLARTGFSGLGRKTS